MELIRENQRTYTILVKALFARFRGRVIQPINLQPMGVPGPAVVPDVQPVDGELLQFQPGLAPRRNRCNWSPEDSMLLMDVMNRFPDKTPAYWASLIPGKTPAQCRNKRRNLMASGAVRPQPPGAFDMRASALYQRLMTNRNTPAAPPQEDDLFPLSVDSEGF